MMKLAVFGLFCLQAALAVPSSKAHQEDWEAWKAEHGKTYLSTSDQEAARGELSEDETFRMKIWTENKAAIEKHNDQFNKGVHTFELGMNEFGDLQAHEFAAKMNGFRKADKMKCNGSDFLMSANLGSLPETFDWRKKGAVTPVKNQQGCGSCWAFSVTGALEGAHQIKSKKLVSLSEQQLVDCASNDGCNGGDMVEAFNYIKEHKGLDTEKSYPYEGKDGKCRFKPSSVGAKEVGVKIIPSGDEKALKEAVATKGPVSVAIDANHDSIQFYKSGIYHEPHCSSKILDHGVLAIGYGKEKEGEYWLIKNSWGATWGDKGYIKMERGNNMCGVATEASYPLV